MAEPSETQPTAEYLGVDLTHDDFKAEVEDIMATIDRGDRSRLDGYVEAYETYYEEEENPTLKSFADILLAAPNMSRVSDRLELLTGKGKHRRSKDEQYEFHSLKEVATRYNGALRELIYENRGMFSRHDLTGWLGAASGDEKWAERIVKGVSTEVAALRELKTLPGVRHARFSTPEEDRRGADVIVQTESGAQWAIDVKASDNHSEDFSMSQGRITIAIPEAHLSGFRIGKDFRKHVFPPSVLS
jgi:hypothetical protein